MPSGGRREGAGRKPALVKRVAKTYRLLPEVIKLIAEQGGSEFIEKLVYESLSEVSKRMKSQDIEMSLKNGVLPFPEEEDGSGRGMMKSEEGDTYFYTYRTGSINDWVITSWSKTQPKLEFSRN